MSSVCEWKASWIWDGGDPNPWNYYLCARRTFDLAATPQEAWLHITADTRYVVWVNGERIGQGPVRAWPDTWRYDTYDLSGRLREGRNVVAVLVQHYGVGTFQSLPTRAGLLAQVDVGGETVAATDESWKLQESPGYSRDTPRITCQQAWVEHFNAFWEQVVLQGVDLDEHCSLEWQAGNAIVPEPVDWRDADFDDSGWANAVVVGPAGCEPWISLTPREIPFLTEEPLYPKSVLRARTVREPEVWHFRLRETLLPGYIDSNQRRICGLLACVVNSAASRRVTLMSPMEGNHSAGRMRVNGRDVESVRRNGPPYDHGVSFTFDLSTGPNLLVWDLTGTFHDWNAAYVVAEGGPLEVAPAILPPYTFLTYGPFDSAEDPDFQGVWNAKDAADLKPFESHAKQAFRAPEQAFLATAFADATGALDTRQFAPLASASEDCAEILPNPDGDVEVLLDFGRMTVGFWEIELQAHEGVVIDMVGFESIQEGALDLAWGMNNVLRYTTRHGWQTYHSVVRRGCRYMLLTLRDLKRPIRIRTVRTLQNTYPCVERGAFQCDDAALNHIWQMGQYTTRLCSEDTYVDCPTYEQTFWVGDARNEGAVNHYAFGEYALSRRCLLLAAESMKRSPVVESQVPSSWEDILPTWSLLWALACEEYWQVTGDREFLEQIYPSIVRQNEYCFSQMDQRGLLVLKGWNLLDWAPLHTPGDAPNLHIQGWFAMVLERTARMAEALGRADEAREARAARERTLEAANRHFWSDTRGAYVDSISNDGEQSGCVSQQSNTVALLSGIASGERKEAIRPLLLDAPEGVVPVGSPFFMFFTFEALAELGEFENILDLTRRYWGFMLDRGATTCWETFPGFEAGGRYTRSHCHAWSAAPTFFQSRYQLGVAPLEPGFARVSIAPVPAGLKWARGRVPTPRGEISVAWESDGGTFRLEADVPRGVEAVLSIPIEKEAPMQLSADGATIGTDSEGQIIWTMPDGGRAVVTASPKAG